MALPDARERRRAVNSRRSIMRAVCDHSRIMPPMNRTFTPDEEAELEKQLRLRIAEYSNQSISLVQFTQWINDHVWGHAFKRKSLSALAYTVVHYLDQASKGYWYQDELRQAMPALVAKSMARRHCPESFCPADATPPASDHFL